MKIVIDIDEEDWKDINDIHFIREDLKFKIGKTIMNGTPLPEHHGRIIDESKITSVCYHEETYKRSTVSCCNTVIDGTDAPTIIEADKGVLEKINEKQNSLRATCKAWEEAISRDGYVN